MRPLVLLLPLLWACGDEPTVAADVFAPPALNVDVPAAGAWVPPGTMTIMGDAQNMEGLTLDGSELGTGGRFETSVTVEPGIHTFEVRGTDQRGDELFERRSVIVGEFASPEVPVQDAMRIGVSSDGVDQLVGLVDGFLDVDALTEDLSAANPVVAGTASVFNYSVDLVDVSLDSPIIDVELQDGRIVINADVPNVFVDVDIFGGIGSVGLDTSANASVGRVEAELSLTLDAVGGGLDVGLSPIQLELVNFEFDTSLIPFGFEDQIPILSDAIRGFIVDTLVEQVNLLAPTLVDEIVSGLDPSFEVELLERNVGASASFTEVEITPDGLELGVDLSVRIRGERKAKPFSGYLLSRGADHELPGNAPFELSVHDNLLNRLMFEVWHADMINLELSTEDGSLSPEIFELLQAEQGSISVDARLPPAAAQSNGQLELQVGELGVTLNTPGGGYGNVLVLTIALGATLDPAVVDGALTVQVGDPELQLIVDEADWGADLDTVTNLMESQLPVAALLGTLTDLAIPLPSFAGVGVGDATVGRANSGVHTAVSFSLVTE